MSTAFTMTGTDVVALFVAASGGLAPMLGAQLAASSEMVKLIMQAKAPVGVGGGASGLRGSIQVALDRTSLGSEIKPTVDYADAVETGTGPHYVPHGPDSALAAWAQLKGLNVYAVAASIAAKGTNPHPYIVPTYKETQVGVGDGFSLAVAGFLRGLQA